MDNKQSREKAEKKRIFGYDIARCFAILAMVYVNYEVVLAYGVKKPEWLRTLATLLEGRAAALFVILAGIGITLLKNQKVLLRRSLFLLVFGYFWQLVWPGDILHFYGFYILFGALLLKARIRTLFLLAAGCVGIFLLLFLFLDYGAGWDWTRLSYPQFWTLTGQVRNLFFNGWHPLFPWLAFLFIGMALGKLKVHLKSRRWTTLFVALLVIFLAEGASHFLTQLADTRPLAEQMDWMNTWFHAPKAIFATNSLPPMPLYILSASGTSIAFICLILILTDRIKTSKWLDPLVACGQMALSCYIAHVLVGLWDSKGGSFQPGLETAAWRALFFGLGAILFSWLWRKRFRKGPLEWMMRKFSG